MEKQKSHKQGFYGVVVSTPDFESGDLGSNPGRTFLIYFLYIEYQSYCLFTCLI